MAEQMKAQHTPGPWHVTDPNEGSGLLPSWEVCNDEFVNPSSDDGAPVLHVVIEYGAEADARLIAAAPEMYKALERIHNEARSEFGMYEVSDLGKEVAAALAKARGESS